MGFAIQTPKIILLNFLPGLSLNLNETDSAVKAKKALQVSYTQIYQTQNCILKAKEGIKVGTGWAFEGNEGWLWSSPKIRKPNSVYLWENEEVKVISSVMDACWRWNIEAVHLVFLKIKSTSSMRVIEKHGWEVWIYGSRNHNPGQQINFCTKNKIKWRKETHWKNWGTKSKINWRRKTLKVFKDNLYTLHSPQCNWQCRVEWRFWDTPLCQSKPS